MTLTDEKKALKALRKGYLIMADHGLCVSKTGPTRPKECVLYDSADRWAKRQVAKHQVAKHGYTEE